MSTQFEDQLLSNCANKWQVRQVIVLDWYDGPREGLCELERPACCFYFDVFAERYSSDDLDDRLFSISEAPTDAVKQLLSSLSALGQPKRPVWNPIWQFDTEAKGVESEQQISSLLAKTKKTNLIIQTKDMVRFQECWVCL